MLSAGINPEDALMFGAITFEWADCYDQKDWERLAKILAPSVMVDYSMKGTGGTAMSSKEFIEMMNAPTLLGKPGLSTQHLIGASKYERISAVEASGFHQIRAAHVMYDVDGKTVKGTADGHAVLRHTYKKIDGHWKLSGVQPVLMHEIKSGCDVFA